VNISLDTLVEAKFRFVTRRKGMARVLRAVEECAGRGGLETKVGWRWQWLGG
jgi:molybdenum cofactor biosynthesis enzyme MoaA